MSNVENGDVRPVPEFQDRESFVKPEIWPPQYPSLVCTECQERSLLQPVLPTAPYPVTPVLEHRTYPRLPKPQVTPQYYPEPDFTRTEKNYGKPVRMYDSNTPAAYTVDVAPEVTEEAIAEQTAVVPPEIQDEKQKRKRKYFCTIFWLLAAFLVLLATGVVVFHLLYQRYFKIQLHEEWHRGYPHRYYD